MFSRSGATGGLPPHEPARPSEARMDCNALQSACLMRADATAARPFYLARSSLQFILASALAEEARINSAGTPRLAFLPDVLDPQLFERAVGRWAATPFERIDFIAPRSLPGQTTKSRRWSAVRDDLLRALGNARPTSVSVFNDRQEAGQAVLIEASQRFPDARRECVEDGAIAYTGFTYRRHSALTRWRMRLGVGRGWHDVQVLGTHPLIQHFTAIHPQLLRPELRSASVQQFPFDRLSAEPVRRLAAVFCELAGFQAQALPAGAVLLTLSSSQYAQRNPDYLRLVRSCVEQLQRRSMPLLFKYHPREAEADYLGLGSHGHAREVPRTIPVECVYLLARERPLLVVAGMSTSLLTAALLMPHARVAALMHASDAGDAWNAELLGALRIEALSGADALMRMIDAWPAGSAVG
jgi:Alpha-2,8-polysialyltransferase (POLYST)